MKNKQTQFIFLILNIFTPILLSAADTTNAVGDSATVVEYTLLGIGAAVIFGAFYALFKLYDAVMFTEKVRLLRQYSPELLEKVDIQIEEKPSVWRRLYKRMTQVVPIEKENDILLNHDYDGIRELDNNLPPWWVALFYITIAIAPVIIYMNHFSDSAQTQAEEYAAESERAEKAVKAYLATQADMVDENTVVAVTAANEISLGKSIYEVNCAACHGQGGEGGVGPNLTDDYWLHGGDIKHIFGTIKYGVPEKGMISWKAQLRPADMQKIASYILTLKGTNPPNQKEPQGEIWKPTEEENAGQELGMLQK